MKVNISFVIIIMLSLSFFIIYSCDFVPITEDEFMNMNNNSRGSSGSGDVSEVRLADAGNYENGSGTFGDPARWLTNNKGRTLSVLSNDFQYDSGLYNSTYDIYDGNNNGSFDTGRFFRVVIDGINAVNGGYNLTPVAKDLNTLMSPPYNQIYIDPQRGKFILPRPVYWSRSESFENITTNPDIGEGNGNLPVLIKVVSNGKFNNCIAGTTEHNTSIYWFPQSSSYPVPAKGILSYWMLRGNFESDDNAFFISLGAFYIDWRKSGIELLVNGNKLTSPLQITVGAWHHIYIVWDEAKGLNGNSIRLYIDNNLVLESDVTITSWIQYEKFRFAWWDDGNGSCQVYIDNVKLWDHVILDDPSWIYNGGTGLEESLHEIYGPANGYKPGSVRVGYYYY